MSPKTAVIDALLNRNTTAFGGGRDRMACFLREYFTIHELMNVSTPVQCDFCGGDTKVVQNVCVDGDILYSVHCNKCHGEGELYYTEEFAVLSHNANKWIDDGFIFEEAEG